MDNNKLAQWILRFVKGMFIGTGFILPGVSGGALAAVFGIYERLIGFIANITKNFKENIIYFLPVGLGGIAGVFLLSFAVSYFLEVAEVQVLWFFIGCILGTMPALWKQASKKGRQPKHIGIMVLTALLGYLFLEFGQVMFSGNMPLNFGTWILAGVLIALGVIVPGLSSSNFLVYLNMYKPMTDGIKNLDLSVIIPIGIGGLLCVICFSKLMDYIFKKAYTGLFHFIFGIVLASTVMIIPRNYNYLSAGTLVCAVLCIAGIFLALWMSQLDEKYKPDTD